MRFFDRWQMPRRKVGEAQVYPIAGMAVAMLLILVAPFVSSLLCYAAFLVCVYRVFRHDARVFAADYCVLMPAYFLFRVPGGVSLPVYLSLLAAVWYFLQGGIRGNSAYVLLILLLNYLIARMQLDIADFMLCFGQLALLCVLLPEQDAASAERTVKLFCASLLLTSLYALVFRQTWQLQAIRGTESVAIWGTSIMRFQGLFPDPNYYMTMLVTAMALLLKLKDCGRIRNLHFGLLELAMMIFGILTYSKTFFLCIVLLLGICLVWLFRNGRYVWGGLLTVLTLFLGASVLGAVDSPFAVVLARLTSASSLDELTTGRTEVFAAYWDAIVDTPWSFLFGRGFQAVGLSKDPHNLYLEIAYYLGAVGLMLILAFYIAMVQVAKNKVRHGQKQNMIAKYVVLLMVMVLYFTLHGMFVPASYMAFFLAFLSILIPKKQAMPVFPEENSAQLAVKEVADEKR